MTTRDSNVIGIDLDGVLADIASEFLKYVRKLYGKDFDLHDIKTYDATDWSGLNKEQVDYIFTHTDIFTTMRPIPHAVKALKRLKRNSWKILIITYRPWHNGIEKETNEWLKKYGFVYDELHFSSGHDKTNYIDEHSIAIFVEDRYEGLEELSAHCKLTYLIDHPYNQGRIPLNVVRVKSWREILEKLLIENRP